MPNLDRRRFLVASAAAATSLRSLAQGPASQPVTLTLHNDGPGPHIPENFVGLSYETQQLGDPNFFSPRNTGLIAQLRALAPHGVLRIGGNTSDVGWWKPTAESTQPPLPPNVVLQKPGGDERPPLDLAYAVTPEAVRNLRAFLDAAGWTCIYGINLGTNTPERAADEAEFVTKTLGPKLEYFQIGNEPDILSHRFRVRATWNADAYFHDWLALADAIRKRVPSAQFGMPDTAGGGGWLPVLADKLAAMPDRPRIAALSHHHYFGGPPSNPKVNINDLLHEHDRVVHDGELARAAAQKLGTPYRMTEGNTCYRGGKPGVSDVFAATLWAADYLLLLASLGYAGVNIHGGRGKEVADSLGGTLPGELLMPDPKVPHPRPFYTPIQDWENGHYDAEPVYFGMLFAQQFAGAQMLGLDFDAGAVNARAYGARKANGKRMIAVINKDATQSLSLKLPARSACTVTLSATSLESRTVSWNGTPLQPEVTGAEKRKLGTRCGSATDTVTVPATTAMLIELD